MIEEAIQSIDLAFVSLFQHTEFHEVSYALFLKLVGGKLPHDEEKILNALGVKF